MTMRILGAVAIGIVLVAARPAPAGPGDGTLYALVTVDFAFRPARITANPGDVLRFVQQGDMPHNVEFREVPDGVDLGDARMGPFLVQKGQTYELKIDERFKPGTYRIVCTPHEGMGMSGVLVVLPS